MPVMLTWPKTKIGKGKRLYYHVSDVPRIRSQHDAYRQAIAKRKLPPGAVSAGAVCARLVTG